MNIQIFGTKKCNDTKKAERFFKERGIKYQFIDMKEKGMSKGEFRSVAEVNGGIENMVNWDGNMPWLLLLHHLKQTHQLHLKLRQYHPFRLLTLHMGHIHSLYPIPDTGFDKL